MGLPSPSRFRIMFAVLFALSCFGFTLFVWRSFGGPTPFEAKGYRIHVLFGSEASQLSPNADVRISGVNVGKVVAVKRASEGADATIQLKPRFAPLPKDAKAIVRFKTLLGETFVAMTPGTRSAPKLAEGATLPRSGVQSVQQIDRVLGTFDEPTRTAFAKFLNGTARALKGRGDDLNASLGHLAPTTENLTTFVELLDQDRTALQGLVRDTGSVLRDVGAQGADVQRLVRAGSSVFATTAARDRALQATIDALPGFLRGTRAALREIDGAARDAAPTLAALRPVIPLLSPALLEVDELAPELRRTFDGLNPLITAGRTGLPALGRILDSAKPALDVLDIAASLLTPLADYLRIYRGDVIAWAARVGAATNYSLPNATNDEEKGLRVLSPITEEGFVGYSRRLPSNRYNPYTAPGGLAKLASGLEAYDCRNTSNPQTSPVLGAAPPCKVQPPFAFRGVTRSFPHLEAAKDGG